MEGIYHIHAYNYNYPPYAFVPLQHHGRDKDERQIKSTSLGAIEAVHNENERLEYDHQQWKDQLPKTFHNERMELARKRRQVMEQSFHHHLGTVVDQYY